MESRFSKALQKMDERDITALLVSNPVNVKYLTGFTGTFGFVLLTHRHRVFFTDSRYFERAQKETSGVKIELIKQSWPLDLKKYKIKTLGFEADSVYYSIYKDWRKKLGRMKLVPTRHIIEEVRQVKDDKEIKIIKEAVDITDSLVEDIKLKIGMTEFDLFGQIEDIMLEKYKLKPSFSVITAFGENTSMPHALPGKKKLRRGDIVLLDMGVINEGYSSDLTRTFLTGKITRKFSQVYSVVLEAQHLAIASIRPGVRFCDVDTAARKYIAKKGYQNNFGHALGHGIGLTIHELPRISGTSQGVLEKGMIFSVEPGIYIPRWGGIRIEDLVLVTDDGCEVLSKSPKKLEEYKL